MTVLLFRVMGSCIAMGEAAGIASSIAVKNKAAYKNIDVESVKQKIIENNGFVNINHII